MKLSRLLETRRALAPGELASIGLGMARAVVRCHGNGYSCGRFGLDNVRLLSNGGATLERLELQVLAGGGAADDARAADVALVARLLQLVARRGGLVEQVRYQPVRELLVDAADNPPLAGMFALRLSEVCEPEPVQLADPVWRRVAAFARAAARAAPTSKLTPARLTPRLVGLAAATGWMVATGLTVLLRT